LNTDAYPDRHQTNALLGKVYLLPIATVPVVSLKFVKNYLGLGLAMALKARDPNILLTMIFGALTLDIGHRRHGRVGLRRDGRVRQLFGGT
jgi:hydrogenase/urease accessory protein HupE